MAGSTAGRDELLALIRDEIGRGGPIPFARFMELALHHPEHGYYAAGAARLGPQGDFFTASDLGPAFGRCMASQLAEMDRALGGPDPFTVVEFGGGRGLLARDVIGAADDGLRDRLRYVIAEASPGMRRAARAAASGAETVDPAEVVGGNRGCVLAVELLDALPVHRVVRRPEGLREIFVDCTERDGSLVEVEGEPDAVVSGLARRYGSAPEVGDEAEVCPALEVQVERMAAGLDRGFVLIVDYGHTAEQLRSRAHRRGTLLAYHRHRTNEDYLLRVGEQDLTAHVNLTHLEDSAGRFGLRVVGRTTQDRFLIAHGILEAFDETDPERWRDPRNVRERLRIGRLIHPAGMGRMFHVIVLSKGVPPSVRLAGLADPFARG